MGVVHTTIGRWENGESAPDADDVSKLLTFLGVTGEELDDIIALATDTGEDAWPGVSQQLAGLLRCERAAKQITNWEPLVVPAMLQTSEYARAILGSGTLTPAEIDTLVTVRMGRRDAFMRLDAPQAAFLVAEPVIHGGIGGPRVMAGQLRRLLDLGKLDPVTIRLVPMDGEWHPGFAGSFHCYRFNYDRTVVHIEHHRAGLFVVDDDDVAAYELATDTIRRVAMSPEESAERIAEVLTTLENRL
ncbi:helix-turn-helix protein [Actinocrispum wychmicini]|uniref:Helix-turn-helix protein n=2 Tax=Actinocrispum wychmicini TaxID=1213861 RepID=A0A4R2JAY3_9PSEU|nr:helix-turn-helix protein [Actinocrispum wychmicini]